MKDYSCGGKVYLPSTAIGYRQSPPNREKISNLGSVQLNFFCSSLQLLRQKVEFAFNGGHIYEIRMKVAMR